MEVSPSASRTLSQEVREAERRGRDARKYFPQVTTLVCPPEKHISVETSELQAAIKNRLDLTDRVKFDELIKLMSGVADFDFSGLKQRVRENFLPFSSGARHTVYLQRNSKSLPSSASLDVKEREFLSDVYEVLRASHFHLLTREEWEIAMSEDFELSLPLSVNWDYMDNKMLSTWWEGDLQHEALRDSLPEEMADRILIFVRGVGTQRITGLLIDQKLDLLMEYTIFWLWDKIAAKLPKREPKPKSPEELAKEAAAAAQASLETAKAAAFATSSARSMLTRPRTGDRDPPAASPSMLSEAGSASLISGSQYIGSTHKYAKVVERNTLKRHCPTLVTLIKALTKKLELQEPSFKDIVVVYRRAYPERKPPSAHNPAPAKSKEERMRGILNHRNIYMKAFGETAMADIEIILPEKKVGIKPFQLVNLVITIVTGVVAAGLMIIRSEEVNWNIVWTALSLVLTRCFTVYTSAQRQKSSMQQQMASDLYDKMQDSQEGVVVSIMEEMAAQQYKQILLAYMMLIIKAKPLLLEDLDNACEDFLVRDFDSKIDYQVDDALPRLMRWGLIHTTPQGKLEAIPMDAAIATLQAAWATAYTAIGASHTTATADLISGKGSAFGAGLDAYHQAARARQSYEASTSESVQGDEHKHRNIFAKAKAKIGGHHSEKHRHDTGFGGAGGGAAQNAVALGAANGTAGHVAQSSTPPPPQSISGESGIQEQMREQAGFGRGGASPSGGGAADGENVPKKKRSFLNKMGLKEH